VREHLYEHRPAKPYDAIVILGVHGTSSEYARTLHVLDRLLKPGGRVCVDASASRRKYDLSSFVAADTSSPAAESPMVLHEYLTAVAKSRSQSTRCTTTQQLSHHGAPLGTSARREKRAEIEARWGAMTYRIWRLYLWGCVDGFSRDQSKHTASFCSAPNSA
jgi:cyclopropane-fatty-acyl-phospholipid synthase